MNARRSFLLGALFTAIAGGAVAARADAQSAPGACDPDAGPCAPMTVKELFVSKCAGCHGADAKGKTKYGIKHRIPNFTTKHWQKTIEDTEIGEKIKGGVMDKGKRVMPAFKEKLTPDQIVALTVYLRGLTP